MNYRQKKYLLVIVVLSLSLYLSCDFERKDKRGINEQFEDFKTVKKDSLNKKEYTLSKEERYLDSLGLKDVQLLDSSIKVNLRYSGTNNFLSRDIYGNLNKAFLQDDVAEKLAKASSYLKEKHSNLRILVWDAVRPVSAQEKMWTVCEIPLKRRHWYVTPPGKRSIHNYGAAVDLTLIDTAGNLLDMGTDFDHFGEEAYTDRDDYLIKNKLISEKASENRKILWNAMNHAGFSGIKYEWWHYNSCSRKIAQSKYKLIFVLQDTTNSKK